MPKGYKNPPAPAPQPVRDPAAPVVLTRVAHFSDQHVARFQTHADALAYLSGLTARRRTGGFPHRITVKARNGSKRTYLYDTTEDRPQSRNSRVRPTKPRRMV